MEVVYCDNCGFKIAPDTFNSEGANHADGSKTYCVKCAPLFKDSTTAIQKVQTPSKAVGPNEATGEFAPVTSSTATGSVMKFYFCETCGKRITDRQILDGLGRDKKLKGIYCKDCAVGVMTMEFQALSDVESRKAICKSGGSTRPIHMESPYEPNAITNVSRLGISTAKSSDSRTSKTVIHSRSVQQPGIKPLAAVISIAGTLAVLGVLILTSRTPLSGVNESRSASVPLANEVAKPIQQRPVAPVTPKTIENPASLPIETKSDNVFGASPKSDPEMLAKMDYDNMIKQLGSMDKVDSAGRLAAIDVFLKEHSLSSLAQSARTLRDGIGAMEQFNKPHSLVNDLPDRLLHGSNLAPNSKAVDSAIQKLLRQTLDLLSQKDISEALRSVEQNQEASSDARSSLKAALETLHKRESAWRKSLEGNFGHKVRLETKTGMVEGTLLTVEGEALKVEKPLIIDGAVMGSATVVVAFADVLPTSRDAVAPLPGPATNDEWMGQALASMAKHDFNAADKALTQCENHTLKTLLKSMEIAVRTAAQESQAEGLWKQAEDLIASKNWKSAKLAFEALQHDYAGSVVLASNAETLKKRMETIDEALGPPKEIRLELGGDVKLELVLIPAGEFEMGSNDGANEKPIHRVKISQAFYMGKYEIIQSQWEKIMGNNLSISKGENLPAENLTFAQAEEFCKKASKLTRKSIRLPTEAEWEYACRAGTKTKFNTGDNEPALMKAGWINGNSEGKTHPIGQKSPNAWGLYDMHGNVAEWCQDWFGQDYYALSPTADPSGPSQGVNHLFRGGAFSNAPAVCRSAIRGQALLNFNIIGFRVVVPISSAR